jgi:hypothetical protein
MPQQPEARGVGRSRPPAAPWVAALGATLLMQVVALFATPRRCPSSPRW